MKSDQYQRIKERFLEACRLEGGAREAFLRDLRVEAPELVAGVETLLQHHEGPVVPKKSSATTVRSVEGGDGGIDESGFGPYRIERELGRGGQGVVYLAEDTRLGRQVALKVLTGLEASSETVLKRFRREAEVASRLDHPGICPVYDHGVQGGVPFITMRFVKGMPLSERIVSTSKEPSVLLDMETSAEAGRKDAADDVVTPDGDELDRLLHIVEKVCRALHAAHEAGVIHRDLKPGNIMVTEEDEPVVLDFGLAREEDSLGTTLTHTGDLFGTPAYMSPEQLTGQRIRLDRRTDVWSLGVTLYEAVTLRRPFGGATRVDLYQSILSRDPERPSSLNPAASRDLDVVVATALDKDRDRRYQTAEDLADDIARIRHREPIVARPPGPVRRLVLWCRRKPVVAALAASTLVSLVAGIGWTQHKNAQLADKNEQLAKQNRAIAARSAEVAQTRDELRMNLDRLFVDELRQQARTLWPPRPEMVDRLAGWLADAEDVLSRLPAYRERLVRLRGRARPYSDEQRTKDRVAERARLAELEIERRTLEKLLQVAGRDLVALRTRQLARVDAETKDLKQRIEERKSWTFDRPADERDHDALAATVSALTGFEGGPVRTSVRSRHEFARTIRHRSIDRRVERWATASREIQTSERYGGRPLAPQVGLVPLGWNSESGLYEFLHLASHVGDELPERDPDGRHDVSETTGIILVLIPGGSFLQGAQSGVPDGANYDKDADAREGPLQSVTLNWFFLSKYEMTQAQWERATGGRPSKFGPGVRSGVPVGEAVDLTHPVEQVSWLEASAGLARVDLVLPTESQWEYAARSGTSTVRYEGDGREALRDHANLYDLAAQNWEGLGQPSQWPDLDDGYGLHAPVGSYEANLFGLHDVFGNVWEWCRDAWAGNYHVGETRPGDGLRIGVRNYKRAIRGAGYSSPPAHARCAMRAGTLRDQSHPYTGVRPSRPVRN